MIKAKIYWDNQLGCYVMSSSYTPKLVEGLKNVIPAGSRRWDPQQKLWFLDEPYGEVVRKIAEAALGTGTISFTSKQVAQQAGAQANPYAQYTYTAPPALTVKEGPLNDAILEFFNLLTFEGVKKSYFLAAQQLHPDKGGDPKKMSRLNELWTRLEKEFFKR